MSSIATMATHQQVRNHFKDELVSFIDVSFCLVPLQEQENNAIPTEDRSKLRASTSSIPSKRLGIGAAYDYMLNASNSMPTVPLRTLYPKHSILQGSDDFGASPQVTDFRRWHRSRDGQVAGVPERRATVPTGNMWTTSVNADTAKSQPLVEDGQRKLR